MRLTISIFLAMAVVAASGESLYSHYTAGGIHSGLKADNENYFHLNGKPFTVYGGSFHYFRVVPERWNETLVKFKAAGLNTVQFYVPWNLHEDTPGHMDFQTGWLNLARFLEAIKANDMFAIARPGPYICAEWELGGFPSWLLADPNMHFRTAYKPFLDAVKIYQEAVLPIINKYQFSVNGGPVIALQLANEYFTSGVQPNFEYLNFMLNNTLNSGFKELIFDSDPGGAAVHVPVKGKLITEVLQTANLNQEAAFWLTELKKAQPGKPGFITEFWPGWYDEWGAKHHSLYDVSIYDREVSDTLFKVNGSINFYMFIGGTNFGFMNGDRVTTSYDYDAPLSEAGNYTAKYWKTLEIYKKAVSMGIFPDVDLPKVPEVRKARAYGSVAIKDQLTLEHALVKAQVLHMLRASFVEFMQLGKGYGQRYGFTLYRMNSLPVDTIEINTQVKDEALIMVDSQVIDKVNEGEHTHKTEHIKQKVKLANVTHKFDILVENRGRQKIGGAMENDRKGINGEIRLDGKAHDRFDIYCLDFNETFIKEIGKLHDWTSFDAKSFKGPKLFRTTLHVDEPVDTFINLDGWSRGVVFVNNFNLGRYNLIGPQKTLYLPGPLLKKGDNTFIVFELEKVGQAIHFVDKPDLG